LLNPGDRRADLEVVAQGRSFQKLVTGLDNVSLGPGEVKSFGLGDLADGGVVVQATNGVPIVVTRRSDGESGDSATSTGEANPPRSWLVLPAIPPSGGGEVLVLQNPGRVPAAVALSYVGRSGPIEHQSGDSVIVPAGRVVTVDMSSVSGRAPVSVIVTATEGTIVAGCASYSLDGAGYAATLGLPIPSGLSNLG
jgi:hypothetical protein